ncbi:MAG: PEGA domain-containing protein [Terriglobia bacterium]
MPMKPAVIAIVMGCLLTTPMLLGEDSSSKNTMVRPVDSDHSVDHASFQGDFGRIWQTLVDLISEYGFKFQVRNKATGRIETDFVVFSKNPHFSSINGSFRAYANPPKTMFKKWEDGKIKVVASIKKLPDDLTEVTVRPEIYGFVSSRVDDSSVTGEWRPCLSNGKFEFEVFNEMATRLKKVVVEEASPDSVPKSPEESSDANPPATPNDKSNVLVNSVPEGAEILLNNQLVGMTPSRLLVKPGKYQVILRKEGYRKFFRQIIIMQGSDLTISAELKQN